MKSSINKKTTLAMLIIQTVILILTAVTAITGILNGAGSSQDGDDMIGWGYFKAFTMDSNILAGICALFIVCFTIRNLMKNEDVTPKWVIIFQHAAATSLFLTICTVVFFLAPLDVTEGKSYFGMFSNDLFVFHLINPVLSIVSFVFLQEKYRLKRSACLWAVVPMAVYAVVYFLMVVVFKSWNDFYNFSFGGKYYLVPAVVIVMLSLTYWLGRLLVWMNGKVLAK